MIPEKIRILMNSEIDGANSPAERDELELYFVRHPEARQYFAELQASLADLEPWPEVEPPAGLHGRIMRAVHRKQRERAARPTWQEFVFGRPRLGYAFSAVAGVLVGLLMHMVIPVNGMGRDLSALELFSGTASVEHMLDSGWLAAPAAQLDVDGVTGQIHAFRLEDKVLVRLTMRAARDVRLGVRFDPRARLQGIVYSDNEGYATTAAEGRLQLEGTGRCRCEFLVDSLDEAALDLDITAADSESSLATRQIRWH